VTAGLEIPLVNEIFVLVKKIAISVEQSFDTLALLNINISAFQYYCNNIKCFFQWKLYKDYGINVRAVVLYKM
jgi:hypothetical protein